MPLKLQTSWPMAMWVYWIKLKNQLCQNHVRKENSYMDFFFLLSVQLIEQGGIKHKNRLRW